MTDRPNVIVITTHDTGRHFGCYGIDEVHTPHVDALSRDGVKLTDCFAAAPICCASRAAMMTGNYPQTNGQMDLHFPPFNWDLHNHRHHLSHLMRDAGYATHLVGIQHETSHPDKLGFDVIHPREPDGRTAIDIAKQLEKVLDDPPNKPFFAQVGFFETHSPFDWEGIEPDESKGVFVPPYMEDNAAARRILAQFQGAVRRADVAVGMITASLDRTGLADNTLVVFTTDHGIEMPRAKWHLYDPGIEIAMVMRWPRGGMVGGRDCKALVSNVDVVPTLLELLAIDTPSHVEGMSFAQTLRDPSQDGPRDAVFAMNQKSSSRAVRTRTHKLIRHFQLATRTAATGPYGVPGFFNQYATEPVTIAAQPKASGGVKAMFPHVELYHLHDDPREFASLPDAADHPLNARLWQWMNSVNDPLLQGPEVTPFYEAAVADFKRWGGG